MSLSLREFSMSLELWFLFESRLFDLFFDICCLDYCLCWFLF